ncbi:peptide MFS transporter [Paenibacillus sp. FSL R7-0048]|jgi:POT family proton-dependent oligopeptide transporter|uniref:peptide MFS transporter n=1 Tax=Paenibacillus TaxID=44249 RepID=UPI00096FD481|nr:MULTISPECIES: peptide MFS transporter [Paenibacillus]MDH6428926.1 POT family proton-dependent oligopeptide transporter [Paenibacillus sp. PastH-4]MDH6445128.1 POT family proton-dependent oligopeptide transporter [Paenibacillus sp. PastF-4]MDH6529021.1 POT family proton-dependent oligopeptide transporter [Paenibacillus sp. PastH-3]OMC65858.1 MFS transporter [Paenibacillus odorifer]OMC77364.1 MFS transporter [Paenibacillus odorifer]
MAVTDRQKIVDSVPQKGFFGHPKGLFTLFFTEFWERFSYYGMRAILVYYMYYEVSQGGLGLPEDMALSIMSIYGSLVYMSGIIGGWLADRLLGTSRAVFYGGVLIMFGHILLAIPGNTTLFFASMVLIVLGTGLLKPNVSSIVGEIYSEQDNRRDAAFSIFYMGINLGGFLSPLIVGAVGMNNFHLGFSIAAVGMFVGLVVYIMTRTKNLGLAGTIVHNPIPADQKKKIFTWIGVGLVVLAILITIGILTGVLTFETLIKIVGVLGLLIPTMYFIMMYRSPKTTAVERSRILAYIPLFIASIMFWAIQEQTSTVLASFADKRTQLDFAGLHISPAWFQSLNPLFIITLAPIFAWLWLKLGNRQPSIPQKFSLGLLFAGLSFLVILVPAYFGGANSLVNPLWLVLSYFIIVIGELCLSPVGLSATTKLAPAAFTAQMMSMWFLSNAAAQAINAQIVKFYTPDTEMMYFGVIGGVALILALILFLFSSKIQNFMKGIH